MFEVEESLKQFPVISIEAGEILLSQGDKTDFIYFLLEGEVSVSKDGVDVVHRSQQGSVYGEMSVMLDNAHSATVKCVKDSKFYCVENPRKCLEEYPDVIWHIVKILSGRLSNLNESLVDVQTRSERHDEDEALAKEKSSCRQIMTNEILEILQIQ